MAERTTATIVCTTDGTEVLSAPVSVDELVWLAERGYVTVACEVALDE